MIAIFGRVKRYNHTPKGTFVSIEYDQKGSTYPGRADVFIRQTVSPAPGTPIFACGNHEVKANERNGTTYQNLIIWADQYIDDKAAVTALYKAVVGKPATASTQPAAQRRSAVEPHNVANDQSFTEDLPF